MNKPFIVAEVSANHLGSLSRCMAIIDAAAEAGADAVKLQAFTPEQMVDPALVIEAGPWAGRLAIDLYRETQTPRAWFKPMFDYIKRQNMVPFASVFHPDDVDFLEDLSCPIYKISSFEILDLPLIAKVAFTGKPMMISTGMATAQELAGLHRCLLAGEAMRSVTLLKCTNAYPASAWEANLAVMQDLRRMFECDVGVSDHTMGIGVAVAAAALGASVIEKHLTIRRADGGPDAAFSMEPDEFERMISTCRRAAAAIGTVQYGPTPGEAASMLLRRKPGGKRGD